MSNLLVYMMWLLFMAVQFPNTKLTPMQVGAVFVMLCVAFALDVRRLVRFFEK